MKRYISIVVLIFIFMVNLSGTAMAHGVVFEYHSSMTYIITGNYDDGTPLSEAQVTVYAPDDPKNAWKTGSSDDEGKYFFTPDISKPGIWTIQFRKAGHGGTVNIEVGEESAVSSSSAYSSAQMAIMAIAVIWGLIGTALYFKKEKK